MNLETKAKESYESPAVLDIKPVSIVRGQGELDKSGFNGDDGGDN